MWVPKKREQAFNWTAIAIESFMDFLGLRDKMTEVIVHGGGPLK